MTEPADLPAHYRTARETGRELLDLVLELLAQKQELHAELTRLLDKVGRLQRELDAAKDTLAYGPRQELADVASGAYARTYVRVGGGAQCAAESAHHAEAS